MDQILLIPFTYIYFCLWHKKLKTNLARLKSCTIAYTVPITVAIFLCLYQIKRLSGHYLTRKVNTQE